MRSVAYQGPMLPAVFVNAREHTLPLSSGVIRRQIYQFRLFFIWLLFHRSILSMERYCRFVARLSDFFIRRLMTQYNVKWNYVFSSCHVLFQTYYQNIIALCLYHRIIEISLYRLRYHVTSFGTNIIRFIFLRKPFFSWISLKVYDKHAFLTLTQIMYLLLRPLFLCLVVLLHRETPRFFSRSGTEISCV
jgi:hypothetical protein